MPDSRLGMARVDLDSATWLFRNGHERAGWLRLITALYWMDAAAHDLSASVRFS